MQMRLYTPCIVLLALERNIFNSLNRVRGRQGKSILRCHPLRRRRDGILLFDLGVSTYAVH